IEDYVNVDASEGNLKNYQSLKDEGLIREAPEEYTAANEVNEPMQEFELVDGELRPVEKEPEPEKPEAGGTPPPEEPPKQPPGNQSSGSNGRRMDGQQPLFSDIDDTTYEKILKKLSSRYINLEEYGSRVSTQDKYHDLKRYQDKYEEATGQEIPDEINAYMQEEIFHAEAEYYV